jgi:bifunctional DNA-binding transcriptional regulator/antitoxin component of YhaV-PrlF toxin-antitoxin module
MALPRKDKSPIIVPPSVRRRAGIKPGDTLEFKASGGVITITAKPSVDDEYTPAQRRRILAELEKGMKDIEEGRFYGPFDSVAELRDFVEGEIKRKAVARHKRRA